MMRYGIPRYRLPREVLDAEVQRIVDLGVHIESDYPVTDLQQEIDAGGFDAVFLAVGAQVGKRAYVPAGEAARILDAVTLLHSVEEGGVEEGDQPLLGRRVVVYGGGNTAMDAARTAKRLGATDAIVVYRRTRERMPAHDEEVRDAVDEGVEMKWLSTIKHVDPESLLIEKMELDESGFPQPTGEFERLEADSVVLALGQDTDLSLLRNVDGIVVDDGVVQVGRDMMTGRPGVFAGGDMVPADRTATVAIGHGKKAARHIDAWLRGTAYSTAPKHALADISRLHARFYSDAPHAVRPQLEVARRTSTFDEVTQPLDEGTALFEARRCMSCGNCFECDNCYGVCPDTAVIKLGEGQRYAFDYDYCKGCGICAVECPAGAIEMQPETI